MLHSSVSHLLQGAAPEGSGVAVLGGTWCWAKVLPENSERGLSPHFCLEAVIHTYQPLD